VRFYRSDARRRKAFHDNRRMFARLSAFVIWSLVAATAVFWVLRLSASPPPVPPYAVAVGNAVAVRGDLSRLFGAPQRAPSVAQATPEAPSRFKLYGVMAPRSSSAQSEDGQGLALIAVDGKPARPYAVGARLDSDLVLQSVGLRTASIGPAQGARSVLLELPALPAPNTGVLGSGALGSGAAAPLPGLTPPALPAAATSRMQSAIQAAQAAQAAQAVQGTQPAPAGQAGPAGSAFQVGPAFQMAPAGQAGTGAQAGPAAQAAPRQPAPAGQTGTAAPGGQAAPGPVPSTPGGAELPGGPQGPFVAPPPGTPVTPVLPSPSKALPPPALPTPGGLPSQ